MKKLLIVALALGLVVAFSLPAAAFESEFGGYWRTRAYADNDFTGNDTGDKDVRQVDTRTRLYYTAKFSDDFKFVNKFEFNTGWGDTDGGDIGADGKKDFRIKNSYVDFNLAPVNAKIGIQGMELARGFLFSDDFSGAVVTYKGDGLSLPFIWMKAYEGGKGDDANDYDVDYYGIAPSISRDKMTITPFVLAILSENESEWGKYPAIVDDYIAEMEVATGWDIDVAPAEANIYYLGLNLDADLDVASSGSPVSIRSVMRIILWSMMMVLLLQK